ncbi:MAG: hypothetical protein KatS3mg060_1184 [Dehalococcoidia bacterium]|nr:MAG: hypothetical protein KatS3mg060_1184 [Dehalococcoidia bacterium]
MRRTNRPVSPPSPSPAALLIRQAIREQGRKLRWVADQLGMPAGTLSPMLCGYIPLRSDVAERAALLLGIPRQRLDMARDGHADDQAGGTP